MIVSLVLALAVAAPAAASNPVGVWRTPVDDGLIRIEPCGEALCGHVVGSAKLTAKPDQVDVRNRDPSLRARPILGLLMMRVKPVGPGRWGDGWVYSPNDGGTYSAKLEIAPDGRLRLTGCVAPLLCQTQTWTRAG